MRLRLAGDDELMQATAGGDEDAFAELMRRHHGWVRSLVFSFVRDQEQADDLAQETFCRAYQHAGQYHAQGQFVAWLKRITANLAKDALRRRKQVTMMPLHEVEETLVEDSRFDPAAALAAALTRDEMRAAIQTLPEEQRLALVMHYFGDMSLQDIAWAMQCPVGTVKSRIFYALRRIRQTMTQKV
jgi:RNA polymerase sigma-70 factor (ECF subfamily)